MQNPLSRTMRSSPARKRRRVTARAKFTQADVRRAMKAAQQAGYVSPRIIIHPDGVIEIVADKYVASAVNDDDEDFDL